MILLSSPLKNDPPGNHGKPTFFLGIEIFTTKTVNSKSLRKICRRLLSTMNVLKLTSTLVGDLMVEIIKVKPGLYVSREDRKHMVANRDVLVFTYL